MELVQFTSVPETTLIRAARCGDLEAFNELILKYQHFLFSVALRLLNSDEDAAADAVQETLLSAFCQFNSFRGPSLQAWLARIVANVCYDVMRQRQRRPSTSMEVMTSDGEEIEASCWLLDIQADPALQIEASELERALQQALDALPPHYRLMVVLVDVHGLSYEAAANAAGIPLGTLKSRLARARLQLRQSLRQVAELLPVSYQVELSLSV